MEGVFPDIWKSGKIFPTFKKGSKNKIENYRPVCLFSNLGKLFEAVIRKQLTSHLEKFLPDNMYGFRPGRSTQDAVSQLVMLLIKYIDIVLRERKLRLSLLILQVRLIFLNMR